MSVFLFAFGNEGFESIVDLTRIDEEFLMAKMVDIDRVPTSVSSIIHMLKMSAQFNGQRQVEIWMLNVDDGITEEHLREWADDDPQGLADIIRERGESVNVVGSKTRVTPVIV